MSPYILVILSAVCWSFASQFYAHYGAKISVRRLNFYKSCLSFIFFALVVVLFDYPMPNTKVLGLLVLSGFLGFFIGDLLIFTAFSKMGPSRTQFLQAFTPFIVAVLAYFFLAEKMSLLKIFGLLLMSLCIVCLSLEKNLKFKFDKKVVALLLLGISLDAIGIILTKKSFMLDSQLEAASANMARIFMAVPLLAILNVKSGKPLSPLNLSVVDNLAILTASFLGTFLALLLFVKAFSRAPVAEMMALGNVLVPVFSGIIEHVREKAWPSKWFLMAFGFVLAGSYLLIFTS